MGRISEKMRSQSGASILLALLFFLLCAMVGASVLMAAASNAGKIRSNRQEQQKYFTLSSALQLVCDELEAAQYTAKYRYVVEDIGHDEPIQNGDETGSVWVHDYYKYTYTQETGAYSAVSPKGLPEDVLPLLQELDWLFSRDASAAVALKRAEATGNDQYDYVSSAATSKPQKHLLSITVNAADKSELYQLVTVTVQLGETDANKYYLYLSATLEDDPNYVMYAELVSHGTPSIGSAQEGENTSSVTWTLSQITKEASSHAPAP